MVFTEFEATENDNERRLDKVVKRIFESKKIETVNIFKLIRKDFIKLNNKKVAPEVHVKSKDIISIASFLINQNNKINKLNELNIPKDFKIKTAFKNEHIWIISKESGINVQPSKDSNFCLADFVAKNSTIESLSFKCGPLHRIDKWTSGLVAFSQSLEGARWFSENIKNHSIKKTYLAILDAKLNQKQITITDKIEGKPATTIITEIAVGEFESHEISLVKVNIETGRKHQIRIHCAKIGSPLLGDTLYKGRTIKSAEFSKNKFFLHAWTLELPKNNLNLPHKICAEIPESFKKIINLSLKNYPSDFII